jgi:hypothetical protein
LSNWCYTTIYPGSGVGRLGKNRVGEVKNGSVTEESYLYDPDGQRIKKIVGSSTRYYPFAHYEIAGSTVTKYYFPSTSSGQASTVNGTQGVPGRRTAARYNTTSLATGGPLGAAAPS